MQSTALNIERLDMQKLLGAASGDAALLYLYLKSGNDPQSAARELQMSQSRLSCAGATLRQLGLWQEDKLRIVPGERPVYSETDVMAAMESDRDFQYLYSEVQRLLGKALNTEEMKVILGFVRYLGMSPDVVCVLICYCKDRARQRGNLRNPSLHAIEKEAYRWAEEGIDTMEEASAYIQAQNLRASRIGELMRQLQIYGRKLTPSEEKYARQWLDWGLSMDAIALAYDRTCLNTGGMNWSYMNKILKRWQEAGLLTAEQVKTGDKKPAQQGAVGQLGNAELENIQRLLRED